MAYFGRLPWHGLGTALEESDLYDWPKASANGPVRLNVLASMLGVSTKVLTKTVEPFLLRSGLVVKTDAGLRTLTESGQSHLDDLRQDSVENPSD